MVGDSYLESFRLLYPHFFFLRGYLLFYAFSASVMTRLWQNLLTVGLPRVLSLMQFCYFFSSGFPSLLSFVPFDFLNV